MKELKEKIRCQAKFELLKRRTLITIALWMAIALIIPTVIDMVIVEQADNITPEYRVENEKLKAVMGFEKKAIEKNITYKYGEKLTTEVKDVIKTYYKDEFPRILAVEDGLQAEMKDKVAFYHLVSMFFPSSYYRSVSEETSSRGFLNYFDFSQYMRVEKEDFFKFYMDKLYFSSNFSKIENFIKDSENVYYAVPRLPCYHWLGVTFTIFLILLLLGLSYRGFNRSIYSLPAGNAHRVNPKKIELKSNEMEVYHSYSKLMTDLLFIKFSGKGRSLEKKGYQFQLLLDGVVAFTRHAAVQPGHVIGLQIPVRALFHLCRHLMLNGASLFNYSTSNLRGQIYFAPFFHFVPHLYK